MIPRHHRPVQRRSAPPSWVIDAASLLRETRRHDYAASQRAADKLRAQGGNVILAAVMFWIDRVIAAQGGFNPDPGAERPRLEFIGAETGDEVAVPDLPEECRWAAQMISARAAQDDEALRALLGILPTGGPHGPYINAVLLACAETLNRLQGTPA